ncbi:hydralysin-like [Oscarella lobularis]|uniref:hydralysin-like n=1 Tax=Oscarella lobularis TaxID=121494 RepID=UPI0033135913
MSLVKDELTFDDLNGLDSSPDTVRKKFSDIFHENPDGIAVNSETRFGALKPAVTVQYNHPAYKVLGDITYSEGQVQDKGQVIMASNYAVNKGTETVTITLNLSGTLSQSDTSSSSVTAGMTFTTEFTIEGVFKIGGAFNTSITVGKSKTETKTTEASSSINVPVPPKSKKKVTIVGFLKEEKVSFSAPITVSGMMGANFPNPVGGDGGHYIWFDSVGNLLNKVTGSMNGQISRSMILDVNTEVGKAVPLCDE